MFSQIWEIFTNMGDDKWWDAYDQWWQRLNVWYWYSPIMVVIMTLSLTVIMVVAITAPPLQSQEPGRASQQTSPPLQHQLSASETRTVKSVFNLTAIWNSELLCSGTKHCRSVSQTSNYFSAEYLIQVNELNVPGSCVNPGGDSEVPDLVDSLVKVELRRLPAEHGLLHFD